MAGDVLTFVDRGVSVKVEGLNRVLRNLSAAGADAEDMRELMHSLGGIVISNADVPFQSGELAASLRAGKGKTKAVVRAGYSARAPYAGVVHYGNPHRGTTAQPYLVDALQRSRTQVFNALEAGIDALLKSNDLK